MAELTVLLHRAGAGDAAAADELMSAVYGELHRLAAWRMARETPGQTLQPTALVHEAWLRLGGDDQPVWQNRAHFFAAAGEAMRRILIDRARRRRAVRHGGGLERVDIEELELATSCATRDDEMLSVHEALDRLAAHDPRKAALVKLRYFVGMTLDEVADALEVSIPTAKRDWAYARAWLFEELRTQGG